MPVIEKVMVDSEVYSALKAPESKNILPLSKCASTASIEAVFKNYLAAAPNISPRKQNTDIEEVPVVKKVPEVIDLVDSDDEDYSAVSKNYKKESKNWDNLSGYSKKYQI